MKPDIQSIGYLLKNLNLSILYEMKPHTLAGLTRSKGQNGRYILLKNLSDVCAIGQAGSYGIFLGVDALKRA